MRNFDFIKLFPGNEHMPDSYFVPYVSEPAEVVESHDQILDMIFAPDPDTGLARSDLALIMSKDTRPEVAQYIQEVLHHPIDSTNLGDDSDFALESIKDRNERLEDYANRLRSIIESSYSKEIRSYSKSE